MDDQDRLQRLVAQIACLEANMTSIRDQSGKLHFLSPATLILVDKLEERLKNLRTDIDNQLRQSTTAMMTPNNPGNEARENFDFNRVLPVGWERGLTEEKIPYFMNHSDEKTQWNHPLFNELMDSLLEQNVVKYSAYR